MPDDRLGASPDATPDELSEALPGALARPRSIGRTAIRVTGILVTAGLGACSSMLPVGESRAVSRFAGFQEAREAIDLVRPYRTTAAEVVALGFDLRNSANVREIPYPELVAQLAPNPSIPMEALDPGIRDCLLAQQACRAYAFRFGELRRQRTGPFLLDFLNFRRTTVVTGWAFEGLLLIRGDTVLFRNFGGEPQIERIERQRSPLGPLQPAGESASQLLIR